MSFHINDVMLLWKGSCKVTSVLEPEKFGMIVRFIYKGIFVYNNTIPIARGLKLQETFQHHL